MKFKTPNDSYPEKGLFYCFLRSVIIVARLKGGSERQKAINITLECKYYIPQCVSGWYSTNRAISLVPRVDSILPSGPLTAFGIQSVAC